MDEKTVEKTVRERLQVVNNQLVFDGNVIGNDVNGMANSFVNTVAYESPIDVIDDGMTIDDSIARWIEIGKTNVSYRKIFGWEDPNDGGLHAIQRKGKNHEN